MSFDRLHALCQSARSSANVPIINVAVPNASTVRAAESSDTYSTPCCESTALRRFVYEYTLLLLLLLLVTAVVEIRAVVMQKKCVIVAYSVTSSRAYQVQDGSVDITPHYFGQLVHAGNVPIW